ncbi:unnamed protein product, partial [Phaeothamnion confervicola]
AQQPPTRADHVVKQVILALSARASAAEARQLEDSGACASTLSLRSRRLLRCCGGPPRRWCSSRNSSPCRPPTTTASGRSQWRSAGRSSAPPAWSHPTTPSVWLRSAFLRRRQRATGARRRGWRKSRAVLAGRTAGAAARTTMMRAT